VGHDNAIIAAFGEAGLRITDARRAVSRAVAGREGHFTAEDVLVASRDHGQPVGRATVFRSLETLAGLGLIERVDLPSGDHAYVACAPASHHHHVVCSLCGRSVEVGDVGLSPVLSKVEASTGFRIDSHRLELFGICADCRAKERPPA
jgi:Fur family transcriptional regulator, ferric uptake regulator